MIILIIPPTIARLPLPSRGNKNLACVKSRVDTPWTLISHITKKQFGNRKAQTFLFICFHVCLYAIYRAGDSQQKNMCCYSSVWGFHLLTLIKHGACPFFLAFKNLVLLFFASLMKYIFKKKTSEHFMHFAETEHPRSIEKAGFNNLFF